VDLVEVVILEGDIKTIVMHLKLVKLTLVVEVVREEMLLVVEQVEKLVVLVSFLFDTHYNCNK
jgi:hypothetical protein